MKTAISVEDELLAQADQAAKEAGVSRSRLFSMAMADYLKQRRNARMLERLNQVYADPPDEQERKLLSRMKAKTRSTIKDRW